MSLANGTRLGPYEVLGALGAGGMGEVYRARDTRLKREVALKVLPAGVAADADRLARFQREAELLAALNHPNIAQVHGVEDGTDSAGAPTRALVMELIEGEDLSQCIARGPLPLDEALAVARQIADALEAAHQAGIIHRDLKPANVRVRPDGTVKVLDFGLAKLVNLEAQDASDGSSPTITVPAGATRRGGVVGTAAYMSPEQATGKLADKRTDIWAFGVVLYEMLTGRRLFAGDSAQDTIASVLRDEPDWSRLPAQTQAHVQRLLKRCLQRDPRQRLRDIGDARLELTDTPDVPLPRQPQRWLLLGTAGLLAALLVGAWLQWRTTRGPAVPTFAFSIVPPSGHTLSDTGLGNSSPVLAPDGSAVMFNTAGPNGWHLRRFDRSDPSKFAIPMIDPFWAPDSSSIAFWTEQPTAGVATMHLPGGAPQLVAAAPKGFEVGASVRGGSWSSTNTVLLSVQQPSAGPSDGWLLAVPANGGESKLLTVPGLQGRYYYPHFLPDGRNFLFLLDRQDGSAREICLATLREGMVVDPVPLRQNETAGRYTSAGGGRLLFVQNDNLYAQRLDLHARKLTGDAELVVERVVSQPGMTLPEADFSVADTGTVAWRPGTALLSQVTMFNRTGQETGTVGPPSPVESIILSPDDKRLLLATSSGGWIADVEQPGRQQVPGGAQWIAWSADGLAIVGVTARNEIVQHRPSEGSKSTVRGELLTQLPFALFRLSSDGSSVVAARPDGAGLWWGRTTGTPEDRTLKLFSDTGERLYHPRFSPDGQWLVFGAAERRDFEFNLFIHPFPGPGTRRRIAPRGIQPEWRADGRELVYIAEGGLWSVAVEPGVGDLRVSPPRRLFTFDFRPPSNLLVQRLLAVSRDGSRFYVPQRMPQAEANVIHVRTNSVPTAPP